MFIGHFAVAFGAKKLRPAISLGTLFISAQLLDLLWPTLLLLGCETVSIVPGITAVTPLDFTSYPISHSLLAVLGWSVLFGLAYRILKRDTKGGLIVGILVLSHWVLDLLMHRPDLPLYPGNSPKLGLGLRNSVPASLILELLLLAAGVVFYIRATMPVNKSGHYGLWALIIFLLIIHLMNFFGPAPARVTDIAWAGQLQWILVGWGWWVDRNRQIRSS